LYVLFFNDFVVYILSIPSFVFVNLMLSVMIVRFLNKSFSRNHSKPVWIYSVADCNNVHDSAVNVNAVLSNAIPCTTYADLHICSMLKSFGYNIAAKKLSW